MDSKPLVVIVGPTASGKTKLAIELAERYAGEIICADSRTVYRGMDIGTAKPTAEEQARAKHWGIDLVDPDQRFTAADFKKYANQKILEIRSRGHVPFLVGGTGLYINAVIFDYEFGPPADIEFRKRLEDMSLEELYIYCDEYNIELPENKKNKRYVIRAIEQKSINSKSRSAPIENAIIVGIATNPNDLRARIEYRAEQLFQNSVVEEAKRLGEMYGWDNESMTGNIYPLCRQYSNGELTIDQAKEKFTTLDWRLAKRQLTWFKRNQFIKWLSVVDAGKYLSSVLASEQ